MDGVLLGRFIRSKWIRDGGERVKLLGEGPAK
jgi:hypothetical protein